MLPTQIGYAILQKRIQLSDLGEETLQTIHESLESVQPDPNNCVCQKPLSTNRTDGVGVVVEASGNLLIPRFHPHNSIEYHTNPTLIISVSTLTRILWATIIHNNTPQSKHKNIILASSNKIFLGYNTSKHKFMIGIQGYDPNNNKQSVLTSGRIIQATCAYCKKEIGNDNQHTNNDNNHQPNSSSNPPTQNK